ncbi:MAG TPA: phage tail protein [Chroococcidiopsis sp.]
MVNGIQKRQKAQAPWGVLGDLEFELEVAPLSLDYSERSVFAEHDRIEGKPGLQYTGEDLREMTWTFRFAAYWCDPDEQLRRLQAARSDRTPRALVLGANRLAGSYAIEKISVGLKQTDSQGRTIELQVQVSLKEVVIKTKKKKKIFANPFKRRV